MQSIRTQDEGAIQAEKSKIKKKEQKRKKGEGSISEGIVPQKIFIHNIYL